MDKKEKETLNDNQSNEDVKSNLEAQKEELHKEAEDNSVDESCKIDKEIGSDEIKTLKEELEEYKNKYIRLNADFQNYKRRTEKEKNEIYQFGSEKVIIDMLGVLDNLERAINSANNGTKDEEGLLNGIQMIYKQFKDILSKHGVEEINSLKKEFDPNLHHAVIQEEVDGVDSNIVLEVFEKGYLLNSKVIRPSMVKVSK